MPGSGSGGQRVVVVLGFHRSGTSMVTRMLNLLGIDLGEERELLEATAHDNQRGYWEPRWMIQLNEELLELLGGGTFLPFSAAPGWEHDERLDPLRDRARALVAQHFSDQPLWGWKDPRTSLTLPFWRTVVDAPMSFVVCVRNPADSVASALKRGIAGLPRWAYAERWLDYTGSALLNTLPEERTLVFYEDALADPAGEAERLAAQLGLALPSENRLEASAASVDPALRHHTTNALELAVDPGLPVEVRALYLLLRARRELEPAAASTARLPTVQALERIAAELGPLRGATLETGAALGRAELDVAQARELLAERDRDLTQVRETLAERDATVAELNAIVAERDAAIAVFRTSRSWQLTKPLRMLAEHRRRRQG